VTSKDWLSMLVGCGAGLMIVAVLMLLLTKEQLVARWFRRGVVDGIFVVGVVLTLLISGAVLVEEIGVR